MKQIFYILTLALFLFGCKSVTTVVNNVPEREANEIVVLLASRGIEVDKIAAPASSVGGGSGEKLWNITIPPRYLTEALAILNQAGLPRIKGTSLLDLFGSQGLVPSEMQNKIRYQEGLSEQLATTIRKMDGIIDANVQITLPQDEEDTHELTASVYVKHRGILDNPNSLLITKIKRLISSAIPGLTVENVSVVSDRALISEISPEGLALDEGLEYVSVWGVTVARNSTGLFRFILYFFIIFFFIIACAAIWVIWKTYPLIAQHGLKTLFEPKPYDAPPEAPKEEDNQAPLDESGGIGGE